MTRASVDDARRFFSLLAQPGDVFELRGLARINGRHVVTAGFFDDIEQLTRTAIERSGKDDGVYVTVNPVNPALLARAPKNRVRTAGSGDTTSDRDVRQRRSLLVDIDPVRPTGISSTNEEHDAALSLADRIRRELTEKHDWPSPIFADSGNGAHLIFKVDLPVDDGGLIARVLKQLSKLYSSPELKVDEKVFNPARISKIYGTLTCKGENTPERPHRIASILAAPAKLDVLSREKLEMFAPAEPPRAQPATNGRPRERTYTAERATFNVDDFIMQHLPDAKERSWASGRKWILPVCPFNDSHDRGEAHVEQLHSGAMSAGCLHESCKWGWRELRAKFEPEYAERQERFANGAGAGSGNGVRLTNREPPPEVLYAHPDYNDATSAEYDRIAAQDADEGTPPNATFRLLSIDDALDDLAALANATVFPTPFETLNRAIGFGGYLGTQVYTVAAGTGRGKTTWVAQNAACAADAGCPVLVSVHELGPGYFVARRAAGVLETHSNNILRGRVARDLIHRAMPYPNMHFLDSPTLQGLADAADHVAQIYGRPPLLIVDYLQKLADQIAAKMQRPDLRLATNEASDVLLKIGKRTGAAILSVSSIGRGKAQLKTPRKFHPYELVEVAKESGAVEYDGAGMIVLTLSNDTDGDERIGTISLAKARFGTELHIDGRYNGGRGIWRDCGEVASEGDSKPTVTTVAPKVVREDREDVVREKIIAELHKQPARSKTSLKDRISGCRKEVVYKLITRMLDEGVIAEIGGGLTLSPIGRQLVIQEGE